MSDAKQTSKAKSPSKPTKQSSKSIIYSSDEDDIKSKSRSVKRRNPVKPKTSATITPKVAPKPVAAVSKASSKTSVKALKCVTKQPLKSDQNDPSKKKSIFSPENSSESDGIETKKSVKPPKPRPKARTVEKPKLPPPKEKKRGKTSKSTLVATSASSVSTTTTASSCTSDSGESSTECLSTNNKKVVDKKKTPNDNKTSDSDNDVKVTRKLTRSASTRKSKHVLGKNLYSDSDSDTESTKRSLSRSPVKRAAVASKGKTKNNNKKSDSKSCINEIIIIEERKCPLEDCNSLGHLCGKYDNHFTLEACPMFHNLTASQCKDQVADRRKREELRKKATAEFQKKSPKSSNQEQKQHLQKIRDIHQKFKMEIDESKLNCASAEKNLREPDMAKFVPDYDLKLFRDAQSLASEKIEEDLKTQPHTKGTKCIEMGKFEMEVWYQSPYPEDYARLPKLYICEYCLR